MKPLIRPKETPRAHVLRHWLPRWFWYSIAKGPGTLVLPYRKGAQIIPLPEHCEQKVDGLLLLGFKSWRSVPKPLRAFRHRTRIYPGRVYTLSIPLDHIISYTCQS